MTIEVLAPKVVSKIAAGEVVERPASVVKELVENSLDAGATQISIEARGGGVKLIRVTDNGSGMPAAEIYIAFQRHATSKISRPEDLDAISSLGFRGEALPSIAAVAQVEVLTRTAAELAGNYLRLEGGSAVESGERAGPNGTTVTVRDLFRDVPARLKFLKSAHTEGGHISNIVTQYSMAYPGVRFNLLLDGRTALQTAGSGELRDVLMEVYGVKAAEAMIVVGEGDSSVKGLASPPSLSRSSRAYLSFFVNRRWVNSRLLGRATLDAYKGLLMTGRNPIVVLHISIPNEDIDVNVHPSKTEVKFRDEQGVFTTVQREVRAALVKESAVPQVARRPETLGDISPAVTPPTGHRQVELFESPVVASASSDSAAATLRLASTSRLPI